MIYLTRAVYDWFVNWGKKIKKVVKFNRAGWANHRMTRG
jgi:hypothetical protein